MIATMMLVAYPTVASREYFHATIRGPVTSPAAIRAVANDGRESPFDRSTAVGTFVTTWGGLSAALGACSTLICGS
jgi:hypothetical protein